AQRRGEISEVLGREHEAMDAFAEATSLNPGNRPALIALARTAVRLGMLKTAIEAGEALLDLIPSADVTSITAARLQLAELCHENGELDRAIDYYEMVLSEEPKSLPALRSLVGLYAGRGDYEASARALQGLIALSP